MGMSIRRIFLLIRGIDQSGRARKNVAEGLQNIEKRQEALAKASTQMLFAGAAFATFGAMATRALLGTLETTSAGTRIMTSFGTVFTRLKQSLAEVIIDRFGDTLVKWLDKLNEISKNDTFMKLIGGSLLDITLGMTITGITFGVLGLSLLFIKGLLDALVAAKIITAAAASSALGAVVTGGAFVIGLIILGVLAFKVAEILIDIMPESWKNAVKEIQEQAEKEFGEGAEVKWLGSGKIEVTGPGGERESFWDVRDWFREQSRDITINVYTKDPDTEVEVEDGDDKLP